jgi:carbon-monoxide dehydrogenase small subunit
MEDTVAVTLTVNGERVARRVPARLNLVDFLREELGLTGTRAGCEHGVCGACTVRLDGAIVRACLLFAAQLEGAHVETIEGLSESGELAGLQAAFLERNALQCGFCTAGMLIAAAELVRDNPVASRDEIRDHLAGNYCRCTGYHAIVDAVEAVCRRAREGAP